MTTFLLIRHAEHALGGQTIAGRAPDVHLSEKGQRDAEALAQTLAPLPIRAVYCSPLERTRQSAAPLAALLDLPVQMCESLLELEYGEWTGQTFDVLQACERWQLWNSFRSATRIPGGESMLEVQARVVAQLNELRASHRDECVALFSHGDVIRAALAYFLGVPLDLFLRIEISLASVSVVTVSDDNFWVVCVNRTNDLGALPLFGGV